MHKDIFSNTSILKIFFQTRMYWVHKKKFHEYFMKEKDVNVI